MSREILEGSTASPPKEHLTEKLIEALEDALLSTYKKTPGAARYAKVEIGP